MARNFAESIEVQHNFISQGERQFHKYWFIFLCSTSESHCHIIHLCSHWHLSRSELKSWNSKFTFLQPGKREIIFLLNSNVVVPIRCFVLIWNWKMFLLKTIFCQTVFILQATWLYHRIFLGFIGRKDNGFLIIKQPAVLYFCDIFTKPNCAFVLFSRFCKKMRINYPHTHVNLHFTAPTSFSSSMALKAKRSTAEANEMWKEITDPFISSGVNCKKLIWTTWTLDKLWRSAGVNAL